jgi:Uma2 family endonuclease
MNAPVFPSTKGDAEQSGDVLSSSPMAASCVIVAADVVPDPERWVLTEEHLPESSPHDLTSERLRQLLLAWADRAGRHVKIGCNLAVRWDREHPQYGVDPDVYFVEPPPPEGDDVMSLLLWQPGHFAPRLAVEIVSASSPQKDYRLAPAKYAVCGVGELWVIDPLHLGPRADGGPHRVQVWRRREEGCFERTTAGDGPAWSDSVQGWIHVGPGRAVRICNDEVGLDPWLTRERRSAP